MFILGCFLAQLKQTFCYVHWIQDSVVVRSALALKLGHEDYLVISLYYQCRRTGSALSPSDVISYNKLTCEIGFVHCTHFAWYLDSSAACLVFAWWTKVTLARHIASCG